MKRHLTSLSISSLLTLICWFGLPSQAEIPFEQIKGIYSASKKDQEANSPLWGMVAIQSYLLPNIRFFGPYGPYTKTLEKKFPEKRMAKQLKFLNLYKLPTKPTNNASLEGNEQYKKLKKLYNDNILTVFNDVPQNYIAALIQHLFRSPDGAIFTATSFDRKTDPLQKLVKNNQGDIDLTNMNTLIGLIIQLKKAIQDKNDSDIQKTEQEIFELIAGKLETKDEKNIQKQYIQKLDSLSSDTKNTDNYLAIHLANTLIEALKEEMTDQEVQQLYPPNICMLAILTYIWKVADKKSDLAPLTTLFKKDADLSDNVKFSVTEYNQEKQGFLKSLQKKISLNIGFNEEKKALKVQLVKPSPEMIALFRAGYAAYEGLIPTPVSYKQSVKYSGYKGGTYPDCGETSLRNFFYIVFNQGGHFGLDRFDQFLKNIQWSKTNNESEEQVNSHGRIKEIKKYFQTFPSTSSGGTQAAHDHWSDIVSGLNLNGESCPYKSGEKQQCVCNISAGRGLFNILNVIGKLIPDTKLAEPWKTDKEQKLEQMGEKLNRLCKLVSHDGFNLGWHILSKHNIPSETGFTLTFTINDKDAFDWNFTLNHFEIKRLTTSGWPNKISWDNSNFKNYPLLQAWFVKLSNLENSKYQKSAEPFFVFAQDLKNNDAAIKVADYLFDKVDKNFYPFVVSWLKPFFNDLHSRKQLKAMMIGHPDQHKLFTKEEQEKLMVEEDAKELLFDYILKYQYIASLKTLIEKDKNILMLKFYGKTILLKAADYGSAEVVNWLLANKDARNVLLDEDNIKDTNDDTPLHLAARRESTEVVKALLANTDARNVLLDEKNIKDTDGNTPLDLAIQRGWTEGVNALLADGEAKKILLDEKNIKNAYGNTPLHLASRNGYTDVVNALLADKDARKVLLNEQNIRNKNDNTPLHLAAEKGKIGVVNALLEDKDARKVLLDEKNIKNENSNTPLHLAAEKGKLDVVKALLADKDARNVLLDKNNINKYGDTPLHLAAEFGYTEVVKALLEHKDVRKVLLNEQNIRNINKKTPSELTENEEIKTVIKNAEDSLKGEE